MLNRRQFVSALVSLGVLGSGSWRANAAQTTGKPRRVRLDGPLSKAVFLALLGETFRVSLDRHRVALTLIDVADGGSSAGTEQFTLLFKGPRDLAVTDGLYTIRHRTAGSARFFLQPAGYDDTNGFCIAPFNLLR
jgi:hypothetical protein